MMNRHIFNSLNPMLKGEVRIDRDFPPGSGRGPVWNRLGGFLLDVLQGFASTYRPRQSLDVNITGEPGVLRRGVPPDMRGGEGPLLGQVSLPQNTQRGLFGVGEAFRRHLDSQPLGTGLGPKATGNILKGLVSHLERNTQGDDGLYQGRAISGGEAIGYGQGVENDPQFYPADAAFRGSVNRGQMLSDKGMEYLPLNHLLSQAMRNPSSGFNQALPQTGSFDKQLEQDLAKWDEVAEMMIQNPILYRVPERLRRVI